jgi:type I restriction enzyme, R subunit
MITEDQLEQQCLGWFREGGWETVFGPDIAHDGSAPLAVKIFPPE